MPKPPLRKDYSTLELIETMLAGLHEWRPDLNYPESHSDMDACARGVLRMFVVTRRPLGLSNQDIVEVPPVCVLCGKPSHFSYGEVRLCGNACARKFATKMLAANPEPK